MPAGQRLTTVLASVAVSVAPALAQEVHLASSPGHTLPNRSAASESLLARPAGLTIQDVPVPDALTELRHRSGVMLVFSPSMLPANPVSCDCETRTVEDALEHLLRGTYFDYIELTHQIVIVPTASPLQADALPALELVDLRVRAAGGGAAIRPPNFTGVQEGTIAGQVVEANTQRPLPGAQVSVPGTGIGGLTNNDGRYRLANVPAGEVTVRVQMIGYGIEERTIRLMAGQSVALNFELTTQALALNEVVVTGTVGGVRRRAVGNVVGTLNVDRQLERTAPATLQSMLAGKIPGVSIQIGGGNVGTGGNIVIRGVGTLSQGSSTNPVNTAPLVYIDGVRVNSAMAGPSSGAGSSRLNDINPQDIERIEVIKGPAAATLYGTEASNGVIQIITKRGTSGPPRVNLTVRQGANWFHNPDERIPTNFGLVDGELISQDLYREEMDAGRPMFRTGHTQSYGISVRGGTGDVTYYMSAGHDDEEGYMLNNSLKRTTLRTNLGMRLSDQVNLTTDLGIVTSDTRFAPDGLGGNYGLFAMILWGTPSSRDTPSRGFMVGPPEAQTKIDFGEELNRATASVTATHSPSDWFSQRLVAGFDLTDARVSRFWPRVPEGGYPVYAGFSSGRKELEHNRVIHQTFDYNATVSLDATPEITSATSFGIQYFAKERSIGFARGDDMPTPVVSTVGAAARTQGSEEFVENKTFGVFLQETMGWRDQLFLTAALRADANSAFGERFRAAYYPKLSGTWVLSDADFWNVRFANSFRLRAAWGRSGLQPDVFAAIRTYSPTTGPGDEPALLPANLGNPDLKPEIGTELEVGFDASLFQNRMAVEFTYYSEATTDAILQEIVAPSLGFPGSRYINVGKVSNKGIELRLDARPVTSESVQLNLVGTLAWNSNRLEDLGGGRERIPADTRGRFQHRVGYPLGGYWSKYIATAEWGPDKRLINVTCKGPDKEDFRPMPCSDAPFHYVGPPGPVWHGSFINTLSFPNQGLTLNALWVYTVESRRFSTTTWQRDRNSRNSSRAQEYLLGTLDPIQAAEIETFDIEHPWMERDDHIRLREVSATYALPTEWVQGFGASRASITLSGRNLWTPWVHPSFSAPGLDPEVRRQRDVPWGWQQTQAPLPHSLVMTMRVTM